MSARRVTSDEDLTYAFHAFENDAILKSWVKTIGVWLPAAGLALITAVQCLQRGARNT